MNKMIVWVKKPENIVFLILMMIVTVIGIIDGNIETIAIVYAFFLFGLFIGLVFYLKDIFFLKYKTSIKREPTIRSLGSR